MRETCPDTMPLRVSMAICDARQVCSRRNMLADVDWQQLQHAVDSSAHVQSVQFGAAQLIQSALLIDVGTLRGQSGSRGVAGDRGALIFQLNADAQLLGLYFGKFRGDVGADALFVELVVYVMLKLGLLVVAADRSSLGFLVHQLAVHLDFQVFVVGLGAFKLVFGVQCIALQRGIAQFQDDALGFHDGARA